VCVPDGSDRTYNKEADYTIINYEKAYQDKEKELLPQMNYDCIILDEAQAIKNWNTKTAKAIKKLEAPYKWALTGTPMENREREIVSIFQFLELWPDDRRFNANSYADLDRMEDIMCGNMIRRVFDCPNYMPEADIMNYYIEMGPYQQQLHQKFMNEVEVIIQDEKFNVANALAKIVRLRQVADSTQLLDKRSKDSYKLRQLVLLCMDLRDEGKKVVIFSQFKQMCYIIYKILSKVDFKISFIRGDKECDAEVEKEKFNNGNNIMLCTKSGELGHNMQAAHHVINFDFPFNPARVSQRIGRCRRIGQNEQVKVINLMSMNSIDEHIKQVLYDKKEIFNRIITPHSSGVIIDREFIRKLIKGGIK